MEPHSWDEIERIIREHEIFNRLPETEENYQIYKKHLISKNIDISDYVKHSLFGSKKNTVAKIYSLTINSFPYYVEPKIYGYIVWINPFIELSSKILDNIKKDLSNIFGEYMMRQNPEATRSVKGVTHFHLFSRVTPEEIKDKLDVLQEVE